AYDDRVTVALIVAVVAAVAAVAALVASILVLRRVQARENMLQRELDAGKAEFDAIVEREVAARSRELELVIARARAESMSHLAEEERRIADERRRDVVERERDATARLSAQLVTAQAGVEQRLANWSTDAEKLSDGFSEELRRVEVRQRQLVTEL